jgi:hypothetical protein
MKNTKNDLATVSSLHGIENILFSFNISALFYRTVSASFKTIKVAPKANILFFFFPPFKNSV